MIFLSLTMVHPAIDNCHPEKAKLKFFRDLCNQSVTEGNKKLVNHTKNLSKNWALVTQKCIDLEQVGVNFEADLAKYSQALYNQTWADIIAVRLDHRIQSQERLKQFTTAYPNITLIPKQNMTGLNMSLVASAKGLNDTKDRPE